MQHRLFITFRLAGAENHASLGSWKVRNHHHDPRRRPLVEQNPWIHWAYLPSVPFAQVICGCNHGALPESDARKMHGSVISMGVPCTGHSVVLADLCSARWHIACVFIWDMKVHELRRGSFVRTVFFAWKINSHNLTKTHKPHKISQVPQRLTNTHKDSQNLTKSHKISQRLTKSHKISQSLTKSHKISQSPTKTIKSLKISLNVSKTHEDSKK